MPTVSIILNCYNHEPFVGEAVESVLNQTFADFELILIDNGSTDGSRAVFDRYDDPRIIRFYNDENASLSRRLNEGAARATGEFVCVLYSDDLMLPDKLKRQVSQFAALKPDYGVVYCPALGFDHWTSERWTYPSMALSGTMMPALMRHHYDGSIDMSSPLIRRACIAAYQWYEDFPVDGEAIFFRIALKWKFHFDPAPTVLLRDTGSNWGKAIVRNHDEAEQILLRLPLEPGFRPALQKDLTSFLAIYNANSAWAAIRSGSDRGWARRTLLRGIRRSPRIAFRPRTLASAMLILAPKPLQRIINAVGNRFKATLGKWAAIE